MDGGNKHLKLYNELCIEQLWQNICELSVERCYGCEVDHRIMSVHLLQLRLAFLFFAHKLMLEWNIYKTCFIFELTNSLIQ